MRRRLPACALALLAAGCVDVSDFDPVGNAASIAGGWTIDGAAPSAPGCEALGAESVRVVFIDELRALAHGSLVFDCNSECATDGDVECFDTRPSNVVAEGEWTVRYEATDGGNVVAASPEQAISTAGGHIQLAPAAFVTGTISATFTIDGAAPTFASCDGAGVDTVQLTFDAAGGEVGEASEPCTVGGVGTRVAPGASYTVRLQALDPSGAVVAESEPEAFEVAAGEHVVLNGEEPFELTAL